MHVCTQMHECVCVCVCVSMSESVSVGVVSEHGWPWMHVCMHE